MRGNEYMEQKHPIAWHVPNLINICIDSVEDGEMTGKIYHCYSEEAIAFSNIIRMIETVEEFFDCLQFPQAATQTLVLFNRKESVQGQKLEKKLEQEQILQMRGQKGTFLLNVKYRQNSSCRDFSNGGRRRSLAVCQCTGIYQNIK